MIVSYPLNKLRCIEKSETPPGFAIIAPVSGDVHPLQVIDQPLISCGILGEGVAIEMAGNKIVAPFDALVTELPGSCHRIQLKATNGIKVLMVLTGQTSQLMGLGFNRLVREKQTVTKGQTLLTFNLQQLHKLDNPSYCAVFVANAEQVGHLVYSAKKVTVAEDVLLTVMAKKKTA